jgi:hypothetical protein
MKYYIAGPMRGCPRYNFAAFDEAATNISFRGDEFISPADIDREHGFDPYKLPEDTDWSNIPDQVPQREAVARDTKAILECDAMYMLKGWQKSRGATAEYYIALWLDMPVEFEDPTEDPNYVPDVIEEAGHLASVDRQSTYGHPIENWQRIVDSFAPMIQHKMKDGESLDIHDYWRLMVITKVSRDVHKPKRDNKVDIVGYVQCAQQVYEKEQEKND